jgi:ABC-2 type transport system ATP-binding protein
VTPAATPAVTDDAIALDGLHKSYGDRPAVRGLSLAVPKGSICGLIGPDGAGKTTTMRVLCGLLRADRGTAHILGYDCVNQSMAVKQHLGYMPQRFSLYPDLTVAENLRFFAELYEVPAATRDERDRELMAFSRLEPFRGRRAGQLSGGMKQKLALSCTLIHTPSVLILDEPTTGVDPVSRREFWRILRDLAARGLALLVSTPYMDEAALCDNVVLMHAGRALAHGTPEAVAASFPRRLLEVTGVDLPEASGRLRAAAIKGLDVQRFGDRLHLVHDDDTQARAAADALLGTGAVLAPVVAGIEDVFVEMMARADAEALS